jgi:hypothetical protein
MFITIWDDNLKTREKTGRREKTGGEKRENYNSL